MTHESSQFTALIAAPSGIYGAPVPCARPIRFENSKYRSGRDYAIGAMHAVWERMDSAEIARVGGKPLRLISTIIATTCYSLPLADARSMNHVHVALQLRLTTRR